MFQETSSELRAVHLVFVIMPMLMKSRCVTGHKSLAGQLVNCLVTKRGTFMLNLTWLDKSEAIKRTGQIGVRVWWRAVDWPQFSGFLCERLAHLVWRLFQIHMTTKQNDKNTGPALVCLCWAVLQWEVTGWTLCLLCNSGNPHTHTHWTSNCWMVTWYSSTPEMVQVVTKRTCSRYKERNIPREITLMKDKCNCRNWASFTFGFPRFPFHRVAYCCCGSRESNADKHSRCVHGHDL